MTEFEFQRSLPGYSNVAEVNKTSKESVGVLARFAITCFEEESRLTINTAIERCAGLPKKCAGDLTKLDIT